MERKNSDEIREITYVKGNERFVFRYVFGEEFRLIPVFSDLVFRGEYDFDWEDATQLAYDIGKLESR
jgi:hypothetical protein